MKRSTTERKTASARPLPAAIQPAEAESLREQLGRLSVDQLAEIVGRFLAGLSAEQRLEFMNLLPSTRPADLVNQLPYDEDEDLLEAIQGFCDRVRSGEFVEYGAGYDPEEREYHGFGDDSWIEEMDALFEDTETYFLAQHYQTAKQAYQLLFKCLMIQSDGGFHFTTSDPQAALSTDLAKARQRYFDALRELSTGEALADEILQGLDEYRYIGGSQSIGGARVDLKELLPEGEEVIPYLEEALIRRSSPGKAGTVPWVLDQTAELLQQLYASFKSLEELDRFAERYGELHPWSYVELVRSYAAKDDWQKVYFWASRGLGSQSSRHERHRATLADHKAWAARRLGDASAELTALWEALHSEPSVERYVALRREAIAQGRWGDYYPRLVERLTHHLSEDSVTLGDLWDNRLLVEALLVEGEYESAVERAAESRLAFYGEDRADARKAAVGFLLNFVTHLMSRETLAGQYPEIARRLNEPAEVIATLSGELFQKELSEAERKQQIEWVTRIIRSRIDQVAGSRHQALYAEAARDAVLISELFHLQGRDAEAQRFIAGLHTQYSRHRNFRAELKKLGLGKP